MARPKKENKKVRITVYISKENKQFLKSQQKSQGAIIDDFISSLRNKN